MGQRLMTLAASLVAVSAVSAQTPGAPADRWPQFRGAPPLTGTTAAALPATLKLLWTYDAGDSIESSAAIADGTVYVGSRTGELHAVSLADGSARWKSMSAISLAPCTQWTRRAARRRGRSKPVAR